MIGRLVSGCRSGEGVCVDTRGVVRVVVVGAESTGKTTLAQRLAVHYQTAWVPEYGRPY